MEALPGQGSRQKFEMSSTAADSERCDFEHFDTGLARHSGIGQGRYDIFDACRSFICQLREGELKSSWP